MESKNTNSPEETKEFAKKLAKNLKPPRLIALYGGLGSGKTTFVQGLAAELGIQKRVLSPTFVFIRTYQLDNNAEFYHVDLYRLDSEKDVETIGLSDILDNKNAIIVIEWPEKIGKILPKDTIKIKFEVLGKSKRKISNLMPNT